MLFALAIIGIFVAVSIYFFFRAEKLQRDLMMTRRDMAQLEKENRAWNDTMAVITTKYEEFAKRRMQLFQENVTAQDVAEEIRLLVPLINNYATICRECQKGPGRLAKVVQKCYSNYQVDSFNTFTSYIDRQDVALKRLWKSNTLKGFVAMIDALMLKYSYLLAEPNQKEKNRYQLASASLGIAYLRLTQLRIR